MSSLVSDFLINPVLRQARRFSEVSRSTLAGSGDEPAAPSDAATVSDYDDHDQPDDSVAGSMDRPNDASEELAEAMASARDASRPLSSSTGDTRVDESAGSPLVDDTPRDHLGFPLSPRPGREIPEDDGMRGMRTKIQAINARDIPNPEKARLIHDALLERYRASKSTSPSERGVIVESGESVGEASQYASAPPGPLDSFKFWQNQLDASSGSERFILTEADIQPTHVPLRRHKSVGSRDAASSSAGTPETSTPLGCQHYERNVKLQCHTCKKWYTCRFCHDAQEKHPLPRRATRNMLCMLCATPQRASEACVNCGEISAHFYCNICKLWENRQSRPIYHCNDCGICRRGRGLGKDFFHCKTCEACIPTSIEGSHKCIERSTDCDCPICGEYMFTSPRPVVFMTCGHSIHKKCYNQHMEVSYKCPICNKSLVNMESQFRNLDAVILAQPMPPEFRDTKAVIMCNDCSGRCTVAYHWLGLKCSVCLSYNTVELQILGGDNRDPPPVVSVNLTQNQGEEAAPQPTSVAARETTAPGIPIDNASTLNRRRHSSHAAELQRRSSARIAPPMPPFSTSFDVAAPNLSPDGNSEDEMFNFWGGGGASRGLTDEEEEESEEDASDMSGVDDDDDEDNDIMLIGHR